jgi:hypothetical protein
MFHSLKNFLLFLFIISLTACSYSPSSLKESYAEMASELSDEIKASMSPTRQQGAMIDDYTKQLMQWHRRNKLPEYSRHFAKLADLVKQQDKMPIAQLKSVLEKIDAMPHFAEATHLTHKMIAVAEGLTAQQIVQIEKTINNEYQQAVLVSKSKTYPQEVTDDTKILFRFLNISLSANQLQLIKTKSNKLHDIRPYELQAEKQWNKQLISVLRQSNNPNFIARFKQVWNKDQVVLTAKARQLEQQNNLLMAGLIKALITRFTPEQKDSLSRLLLSISETFGEMAYQ